MLPFLSPLIMAAGKTIAGIVAQMGLMLLTERVVRRVTVVTLREIERRADNPNLKELIDAVADALEIKDVSSVKSEDQPPAK